jgi:hypothetical protein
MRWTELKVIGKEFSKLLTESGDAKFKKFKSALMGACKGRVGNPSISIEE